MTFGEDYLRLLGRIHNFTKDVTGVSVIDAYFGPEKLSPERVRRPSAPEKILANLDALIGEAREIDDELRRIAITSDLESLKIVLKWLSDENIAYTRLVEGIFGITPSKFGQNEVRKARQRVEDASVTLPSSAVPERILKWEEESKISGEVLRKVIDTEIAERTREIERLFEKRVFTHLTERVENRGVVYKTVTGEPWSAYNYYQGNYTSVNVFNIDRQFNRHKLIATLCHEYEHHVANLFKERYFHESSSLDLAAVLLHTKRSVIDEGTADCARDFVGLQLGGEHGELIEYLGALRRMVDLNATYMLNVENANEETAAEYIASEGFTPVEEARQRLGFIRPATHDDKPNFWKPYIYTYFFGRRDYVLPTFQKAQKKDKVRELFRTLYLNPYSRSTAAWRTAFSKI